MKDGGPAFPGVAFVSGPYGDRTVMIGGMSLRDYFAAAALQGVIACFRDHAHAETVSTRVGKAYEYADAMLTERDKP